MVCGFGHVISFDRMGFTVMAVNSLITTYYAQLSVSFTKLIFALS